MTIDRYFQIAIHFKHFLVTCHWDLLKLPTYDHFRNLTFCRHTWNPQGEVDTSKQTISTGTMRKGHNTDSSFSKSNIRGAQQKTQAHPSRPAKCHHQQHHQNDHKVHGVLVHSMIHLHGASLGPSSSILKWSHVTTQSNTFFYSE